MSASKTTVKHACGHLARHWIFGKFTAAGEERRLRCEPCRACREAAAAPIPED